RRWPAGLDAGLARAAPAGDRLAARRDGRRLRDARGRGAARAVGRPGPLRRVRARSRTHGRIPRRRGQRAALAGGHDAGAAGVRVTELATGAMSAVRVVAVRAADGTPSCEVGDARFTLASLFGVQRESLVEAVGREGVSATRAGRHGALARLRTILEPLLA